jgi:endogenous inhibitor of DNA gyrase (YacG/DUF329 family)
MSQKPITVACPTCKKPVYWTEENSFKPFCSERCKLIDLGAWASETYKIAEEALPSVEDEDSKQISLFGDDLTGLDNQSKH